MENKDILKKHLEEMKETVRLQHIFSVLPTKEKIAIFEQQAKLLRMVANSTMTQVRRWKKELEE